MNLTLTVSPQCCIYKRKRGLQRKAGFDPPGPTATEADHLLPLCPAQRRWSDCGDVEVMMMVMMMMMMVMVIMVMMMVMMR